MYLRTRRVLNRSISRSFARNLAVGAVAPTIVSKPRKSSDPNSTTARYAHKAHATPADLVLGNEKFQIDPQFIRQYAYIKPKFGFNGLGELVYRRTYSRIKEDGHNEEWYETVARVVEGTFRLQKEWITAQRLVCADVFKMDF